MFCVMIPKLGPVVIGVGKLHKNEIRITSLGTMVPLLLL